MDVTTKLPLTRKLFFRLNFVHVHDNYHIEHRNLLDPSWLTTTLTYLILTLFSIIPSILLIYLILINALHRNSFHFVILHWTTFNLIATNMLVAVSISNKTGSLGFEYIILNWDANIINIPIFFGMFFLFNNFIKSPKLCQYIIYFIWGIFVMVLVFSLLQFSLFLSIVFFVINIIAVTIWIVKSVVYFFIDQKEETYKLRTALVGIYVVTHWSHFGYKVVYNLSMAYSIPFLILSILLYCNSFINLVLLMCYDDHLRKHFWEFIEKIRSYFRKWNLFEK